jgi:NADH-quinone oxidoreductase subunit C
MNRLETLTAALRTSCGDKLVSLHTALGELTVIIEPEHLREIATLLRDAPELRFEQLMDLCGVDYSVYANSDGPVEGMDAAAPRAGRYAVVYHLLSQTHNWRIRLRLFARDDELPVVDSLIDIWPSANWLEREAFDLFGIIFTGHPDLRRLLTDYGFIGHPFRKDFPVSGNVEMRYDPDQKRVIYQPVTIEPREITPRLVRVENYGDTELKKNGSHE